MYRRKSVEVVLLAFVLVGLGAILGVRLTKGQEPDDTQVSNDALGSGFTYQGQLAHDGATVDNTCDFTFALYDRRTGGTPIGNSETKPGVLVKDGQFTVQLNESGAFGPDAFNGDARWLDIAVQCSGDENPIPFPRQPLSASPYAGYALEAGHAVSAESATSAPWDGLTGIPADLADGDDDTTYSAGSGLTLNSGQFTAQGSPYGNVLIVAKSGGDYSHIQTALDSITDASDNNRYLVWVAPGLYQEQIMMKEYVDVEGAGQNLTTIRWFGGSQNPDAGPTSATVHLAANSELRSLTVQSDGAAQTYAVAIHAGPLSKPTRITAVTALASDATDQNIGIYNGAGTMQIQIKDTTITSAGGAIFNYGIFNDGGPETHLNSVNVSVSGATNHNYGISDRFANTTMTNVTVSASNPDGFAVNTSEGTITVRHSVLQGEHTSISSLNSTVQVATSQLEGTINNPFTSALTCVHSYNAGFNPLDENCQPLP